jgi:hypothetical protein
MLAGRERKVPDQVSFAFMAARLSRQKKGSPANHPLIL